MDDERSPRLMTDSFTVSPGLPAGIRRPLAALFLLGLAALLAAAVYQAGWPREQALMAGILAGTVLLWVTETLPLFATAFISIALHIFLLGNPGNWRGLGFESGDNPTFRAIFAAAVDPVLLLFFSGLVLARAATTTGVDRRLASLVLQPMASTPARQLLGVMLVTSCFSLWMSNTATTALMLALVAPLVAQVEAGHHFRKALIVSVPVSANIAGMGTPIASPPNAIAVTYLSRAGIDLSFGEWMLYACPLAAVLLMITWWWLLRCYPPGDLQWEPAFSDEHLSRRGAWVVIVALATFIVWMTEPWHGVPATIAAALPVTLFFATGITTREDINTLDWDVLILIAGGLTLGFGLQVTGLDERLVAIVPAGGSDLWRLAALALGTLALGTFFSNTAIASMLMPVAMLAGAAATAGQGLTNYALTVAFVASLSMALPMSTPPNAMAYATGEVASRDFARTGGLIGLVGAVLITLLAAGVLVPW